LQSFEEDDKELFFGRRRVIEDLLQKIYENNLVVVTGASGTGKSSVVKAGLIPGLRRQGYRILPVIRPGETPIAALETVLIESKLFAAAVSLAKDMNAVSKKLNRDKTLLVIDQYEELITQCKKGKERDSFVGVLEHFLDNNHTNDLKIVLTVRADFEPQFDGSGLEKYWENGRYPVPSFTTEDLREVILKPVVQEVLSIEPPGLVDRMIDEVIQAPGALPLLSFTLEALYLMYIKSGRTDRVLHEEDYRELGGVVGALRTRADDLYNNYNLQPEHQVTIRKIMLRLVSFEGGELTGKKVLMEDLVFLEEENSRVKTIIDQFLKARLLRKDKDAGNHVYIEPAHDALIKAWATLWEWITSYGEDKILAQNHLSKAVNDYSSEKNKQLLWHDNPRLDFFKKELESPNSWLNKNEVIFVKESIKLKGQKRRQFIAALVGIIIILTGLSVFAAYKAVEAAAEAKIAQSNYHAAQAQLKLEDDPMSAIRLAEEACRLYKKNNVAKQVLVDAAVTTLERPFYNADMPHKGNVNHAVFSPAGDGILTASSDKTAKLWDLQGNCKATFHHKGIVYSASFSPGGTKILTASRENHAQMWNLQGTPLQKFTHNRPVTSAVFSPQGRFILTASLDKTAKLWDYRGHFLKEYTHPEAVKKAVFSPDGTRILTAADDKIARLWDKQGNLSHQFPGTLYAEFSPKGNYIFTIAVGNTVNVYSREGRILKTFNGHNLLFKYVTSPPDEQGLLIVYMNGTIEFWDWQGRLSTDFIPHKESILCAVFSPDGNNILTASRDNTAKLWNTDGSPAAEFHAHKDTIISAVFSPDGNKILTASQDKTAKLWDLNNQLVTDIRGHARAVTFAAFSQDGTRLLSISDDKSVKVWDLHGRVTTNIEGHTRMVNTAVFSPGGTTILTASADNTAKLWDIHGKLLASFDKHTANVNSAVFSPDGRSLLTASFDFTAKLWDLHGKLLTDLRLHRGYVNRAIFSPDGTKILTASYDNTVKLWDLQGNLLKDFNLHNQQVEFALFSPGGTRVFTVYTSPAVATLWNLNGDFLANYQGHTDSIVYAAFSPDGTGIITASNDKTAKLWDLQGNLLTDFKGHAGIVYTAVFSPGGREVLTASADGTVKLWDLQGNILADFKKHKDVVYSAVFSTDGVKIISASADKTIKLWSPPETIIQWLKTAAIPPLPLKEANR
jgi:WD40 repeat protein